MTRDEALAMCALDAHLSLAVYRGRKPLPFDREEAIAAIDKARAMYQPVLRALSPAPSASGGDEARCERCGGKGWLGHESMPYPCGSCTNGRIEKCNVPGCPACGGRGTK